LILKVLNIIGVQKPVKMMLNNFFNLNIAALDLNSVIGFYSFILNDLMDKKS